MRTDIGAFGTATGNTGAVDDIASSIWKGYTDGIKPQSTPTPSPAGPTRFPVTQEFMVQAIVAERNGGECTHPAKDHFSAALHESIDKMVGMLASKYSITCIDQEHDLRQECWKRIWSKLDTFDANKAKFTTWAWRVCSSVLSREYRRSQKHKERLTHQPDENIERNPSEDTHYDTILAMEFSDAVRELSQKYPKWREFLYALLGNPDTGFVPGKLCVAHAATASGMGRGGSMKFYHEKVQPFLTERFRQ